MKFKTFPGHVLQLLLIFFSIASAQKEVKRLDDHEKEELIIKVGDLIKENYVFQDLREKFGQEILEMSKLGKFDTINVPREFGENVSLKHLLTNNFPLQLLKK